MDEALQEILSAVPTPSYVVDQKRLQHDLTILAKVAQDTGAHILLAQKAFSMYHFYPLVAKYLSGTTASGLYEARLAHEEMPGKENHVFCPAYREEDFAGIMAYCDHIVFNSFAQWTKFGLQALSAGKSCGLRINPEHSTQEQAIYDPCAPGSRLGIRRCDFQIDKLAGISGLHCHTLCEQGADALAETLAAVEDSFGEFLPQMDWINLGGGHHITQNGYDIELLEHCIRNLQEKYHLTVYLEPGEAVALNAGFLAAKVLDIVENGKKIAILDTSAACHMPDVIEMPYRPPVLSSGKPQEKPYDYLLAGPTCLAGDIIGAYSFDEPLAIGDRIIFGDMAIYSMVKNNTFNGMPLPAIIAADSSNGQWKIIRQFGYDDFKMRLS
jgi:carboxynorspermidine decarboxylase